MLPGSKQWSYGVVSRWALHAFGVSVAQLHVEPTLTAALGYRANTEATGKATAADYLQQLLSTTFTVIALAA
jgi:hypothetical protein